MTHKRLARPTLVLALVLQTICVLDDAPGQERPWPTDAWPTATPRARGLDPAPLESLARAASEGEYGLLDRLLVVEGGYVVLDEAFEHDYAELAKDRAKDASDALSNGGVPGEYNYYDAERHPYYRGGEVHSLQSVTKSVSSTLIGIAMGRGEIAGTDAPLLSFFGSYDTSRTDPRLASATLDDLLTMRSGIEWHETDRPFDETNTTLMLERSEDWIQFTLDQPMDAAPGTKWVYSSGGSHLMSGVIEAATGRFIDEYAREHLFEPIGIREFHWKKTPSGFPDTEGGLYLRAEDLARFGYLFLRGGRWGDRQVVPASWVRDATARHVDDTGRLGRGYGYQWWRLDRGEVEVWAGLGFGGQYLIVVPGRDVVAVTSAWNLFGPARSVLGPLLDSVLAATESKSQVTPLADVAGTLALVGGRVIDPASDTDRVANVLVRGDRIAAITDEPVSADRTLDCAGRVVAPGFVDVLASMDAEHEQQRFKVLDGVTTVLGMHGGPIDNARWVLEVAEIGALLNHGSAVGHGELRRAVGADRYSPVTNAQLAEMRRLAASAIEAGAIGIGFGINYTPGADYDEIVALFEVAAEYGVPCHVHSRHKGSVFPGTILQSVQEVIAAAAVSGARAQVVHLASSAVGSMEEALHMIAGAREHGVDVGIDVYPYTANMTRLESALFDPGWRERFGGITYGDVMLVGTGERLTEETFPVWRERGADVITFFIPEAELELALRHPLVMVASDGVLRGGKGHPRGAGTFARVLGSYVREKRVLELGEALRKITVLPASRLEQAAPSMRHRGRLAPGAFADVTVFDPALVRDRATYREPAQASAGILHVLVNGVPVVEDGKLVEGAQPGRPVLRAE